MKVDPQNAAYTGRAAFVRDFFPALLAAGVPRAAALCLTAHAAHSTGWGEKFWCWNPAGIKATKGQIERGVNFCQLWGSEYIEQTGEYRRYRMNWRAWPTIQEGAKGFWGLLKARYPKSVAAAVAGDVASYAVLLREEGWYTDASDKVQKSFVGRHRVVQDLVGLDGQSGFAELAALGGLAALALALLV